MKKLILILALSCPIINSYSQNGEKDFSDAFELIEVWLEAQKDYEMLPSICSAIAEDQDVLWTKSFGLANIEDNVESEPRTLYSICSISKMFTSIAIMQLYDNGKLRLDDPIEDLLPWYDLEQQYPESGPITVRSLLTHSSGLPREANFPYWTGPDFHFPTSDQVRSELSEQKTLYSASNHFQYSNLGFTLLGEIVEEISGMPYDDYISKNILIPLGLNNTWTSLPESLYGDKLAVGYSTKNRDGKREATEFFQANGITPAAGFCSNVLDMLKFASWQLRLIDAASPEILNPSTLKYMHKVHWSDPEITFAAPYWETNWGLGFFVLEGSDGCKYVGHGGHCPGYKSILILNPKSKLAISVMINASGTNPFKYSHGIHEILKKSESDQREKSWQETESALDLNEFTGYYSFQPSFNETYISTWNNKLVLLSLPTDSPLKSMTFFKHIEKDKFRRIRNDGELGETLVFERNQKGQIIKVKRHGNYSKKIER